MTNFFEKDRFSTGIMIYEAIGYGYKSKLVLCPKLGPNNISTMNIEKF